MKLPSHEKTLCSVACLALALWMGRLCFFAPVELAKNDIALLGLGFGALILGYAAVLVLFSKDGA